MGYVMVDETVFHPFGLRGYGGGGNASGKQAAGDKVRRHRTIRALGVFSLETRASWLGLLETV